MFNVYIGYDSRIPNVYEVCKQSILQNGESNIIPLIQPELRQKQVYNRDIDSNASTEFTLTRFLVPQLNNYQDWALFCDCDMLFTIDVNEVFKHRNEKYAVMVVKHEYTPKSTIKMDNQKQYVYPRKNWSSFVLYNCSHPANRNLNTKLIDAADPSYLHQFKWLTDNQIGSLKHEYNWLVGYYTETETSKPKILHYTDGGPWFNVETEYNDLWNKQYEIYRK
jgi:lipopolysaccharide biosynthesis glycosyltransferase